MIIILGFVCFSQVQLRGKRTITTDAIILISIDRTLLTFVTLRISSDVRKTYKLVLREIKTNKMQHKVVE